jgi:hypothetical protein
MEEKDKPWSNPFWLAILLLAGVVSLQGGPRTRATPPSGAQEKPTSTRNAPLDTQEQEHAEVSGEVRALVGEGSPLRFVLALVPDPEPGATQLGWLFDSHVDAIQRAAQAARFNLYRRALPRAWKALGKDSSNESARVGGQLQESRPDVHEPGWLVFLHQWTNEILIVFLVGESPTRGVEPAEFRRAFEWLWHLDGEWQTNNTEVAILGPTFSGSAWSLKRAIEGLAKREPESLLWGRPVRIVSGTATGGRVERTLEAAGYPVEFHTTVIPDQELMRTLYKYLDDRGVTMSKVALLVESTTGYGNSLYLRGQSDERPANQGEHELKFPRLAFQFPLHVAQARVAYEKSRPPRERPSGTLESRVTQLELSLDGSTRPVDVVPPLDDAMTSFTVDLVLANTLATMAREDVRYVLIVATDARDKLFLARKVREHLPGVRLLTTDGSLLYTHPDYRSYLEGMIVATTYPLVAKNQLWLTKLTEQRWKDHRANGQPSNDQPWRRSFRTTRITQFPDAGAQGVHNATLALLGRLNAMKDYGAPCFGTQCSPQKNDRPPIWITAVGHGGMWPLAIDAGYEAGRVLSANSEELSRSSSSSRTSAGTPGARQAGGDRSRAEAEPEAFRDDLTAGLSYSRSGASIFLLISLLAAAQAFVVVRSWRPGRRGRQPSAWRFIQPFAPGKANQGARRAWLLLLLVDIAAVEVLLLSLFTVFASTTRTEAGTLDDALVPLVLGGVAVVLPCLLLAAAALRVGGWLVGGILVTAMLAVAARCVATTWDPTPTNVFFYLRGSNFGSGLSPVLPLLWVATALYLWCLHHLRRLHLVEALDVPNPLADERVPCSGPLRRSEDRLREVITQGLRAIPPPILIGLSVVAALPCLSLWHSLLPSFEEPWYDSVFFAAFVVTYFAVLTACVRFAWLWMTLRTLLRQLDHHPLTLGFSRLPNHLRQTLRQRYYVYVPGPSDRLRWARIWLRIGGRFSNPYASIDAEPVAEGGVEERQAWLAHDSAAFFDVESRESEAAGRDLVGSQSEVQLCLSDRAADVAAFIFPTDPRFESKRRTAPPKIRQLLDRAETFVAIQVVVSLGQKFAQLSNLLSFSVLGMLLITFAFSSYPFQPQRLLMLFTWTLAGAVVLGLLVAIIQADRDPLLSRMTGMAAGRITLDRGLLSQVATYGVLPLLAVLGTQFPEAGKVLDSLFTLLR